MKQECKDCNKSLNDCTCIEDTIELPNQALIEAAERHSNETLRDNSHVSFIEGAKWQEQQTIEEVFEWLTTNNYLTDLKETLIENFKNR